MIQSMTGYGLATNVGAHNTQYTVIIKSVNSKFLEIALKIPPYLSEKEFQLRNTCMRQIERGKVTLTIHVKEGTTGTKNIHIDLLKHYIEQLKSISVALGQPIANVLELALRLPDVVQQVEEPIAEEEWAIVVQTFNEAFTDFQKFRINEGTVLEKDFQLCINNILQNLKQVALQAPERIGIVRERLQQYLNQMIDSHIDKNRLEQELIYYIDKLDITEELTRLKSHCGYFLETLRVPTSNGKKLGFITQEIGREVNTIGSKANDASIQRLVVAMKEDLEKIKEQLLNVC